MSSDNLLRRSQVVAGFGPGALVDLPNHSVVVAGLNRWASSASDTIHEPRLQAKLAAVLDVPGVELRAPPAFEEDQASPRSIAGYVFPRWFTTQEPVAGGGGPHRRRRLIGLNALKKGRIYEDRDEIAPRSQKKHAVPVRFVCGCTAGHVDDIDWRAFAHRGDRTCQRTLWVEERGTSGDVADVVIGCDCGRERRLYEARARGVLGRCSGSRPWLGGLAREDCAELNRLLVRTASNAYFAETLSVISLPEGDDRLKAAVERCWTDLSMVDGPEALAALKRYNAAVRAEVEGFADSEILEAVERRRGGGAPAPDGGVKVAEFRVLACGKPSFGLDEPQSPFFAETLCRGAWDPDGDASLYGIERVVAVHRLREVTAQVGFTRFEAQTVDEAGEMDLKIRSAALDIAPSWLPAVENRGEGLFVQFRAEAVAAWATRPAVQARAAQLRAGFRVWLADRPKSTRVFPGAAYVLMHTFSHLLLSALALECGYPASALRERVYGLDGQYGVLIMTATSGGDGTLGGLAACAPRLGHMVRRAVEAAALCSNDPVCAHHAPDDRLAHRPLHGAACHGCLLVAETSCEQRNDLLDRALVAAGLAATDAGFFPGA